MKFLEVLVQVRLARKGLITDFAHVSDVVVLLPHFVLFLQMKLDDTPMPVSLTAMHAVVEDEFDKVVRFCRLLLHNHVVRS